MMLSEAADTVMFLEEQAGFSPRIHTTRNYDCCR